MTRRDGQSTRWSIRQSQRWVPLLGATYGRAIVSVRRRLIRGFVLLEACLGMTMLTALLRPVGEVIGVISIVFFCTAGIIVFVIPAVRLLQLQAKVARHLRANGVSIRHWPDLRDSGMYLAWCRREGLEPDSVASVLNLPPREPVS